MALTLKIVDAVDTLRAIAHPLRMKMLGALRADGPATASDLGRRFGESSGSTSYHLRQLERFGFVVEDDEQPSRRERRWKAAHDLTSFDDEALYDGAAGRELMSVVEQTQMNQLMASLQAWSKRERGGAMGHSDYLVRLAPAQLKAMLAELENVVERYSSMPAREGVEGVEDVALHILALPKVRAIRD